MTEQLNLRLPENLLKASQKYVKDFGYGNIQDLIKEALREKVYSEVSLDFLKKRISEAEKGKKYTRKDLGF